MTEPSPTQVGPDQSRPVDPVDVVEAIRASSSHSTFANRPVPRDLLEQMVWAARRAQQGRSGVRNMVVVDDPALLESAHSIVQGFDGTAGAFIVHCTDLVQARGLGGVEYARSSTPLDAGAACAHLALMAQPLGLGVCRTSGWNEAEIRSWIDLPENIRPDAVVAVGWRTGPGDDHPTVSAESVHGNQFGTRFFEAAPRKDS